MRTSFLSLVLIAGCAGAGTDSADTDATDSDAAVTCAALPEGVWDANGTCFGMSMNATLTLDESGCAFTLADWNMNMAVPAGGSVKGKEVTLNGSGWKSCSGTLAKGVITGGCDGGALNGCSFQMAPR